MNFADEFKKAFAYTFALGKSESSTVYGILGLDLSVERCYIPFMDHNTVIKFQWSPRHYTDSQIGLPPLRTAPLLSTLV